MANKAYESILAAAKEYAVETNNTRLLLAIIEPEKIWDYLNYFANYAIEGPDGKAAHPFYDYFKTWGMTKPTKKNPAPKQKVNRSYVSNVKSAIKRFELLSKVAKKEDVEEYKIYHETELEAMNAYALQVLLDIVKTNSDALNDIDAKIAAWEEDLAAKKAAKQAENTK